ncbi:MAG: dockerin type I domain-containing protein [Ruminococcus sp.]
MKIAKKLTALALTALIAVHTTSITYANAEVPVNDNAESCGEEIMYYANTVPVLKAAEGSEKPDLYALAEEYGYSTDTFQFTNFIPDERIEKEVYDKEFMQVRSEKFSFEERVHNTIDLMMSTMGGCCYGMSAISVLIHNGIITPSDLHERAETLNEIAFDETIGRYILQYSFSQIYHEVQLANFGNHCITTDEERVAELLEMAVDCTETGRYFQISYGIQTDERNFNHAVVGIGTADGKWTVNDVSYDTCILTYDSNCANKEDDSLAGGFSENLCIYINSETNQFCIPGYEISSENGGFIFYVTDSDDTLSYRAEINGTDTVGEDVSNLAQMYRYSSAEGSSVSAWNEEGELIEISDLLDFEFSKLYGGSFFIYPATSYKIEQRNSSDYGDKSGVYGSIWGNDYCIRYLADDYYDYTIDVAPTSVSVTNLGATSEIKNDESKVFEEMCIVCSISYDGEYYYYFAGTAAENETVTMTKTNEDVIITSNDGSLKGTLLVTKTDTAEGSSAIEYTINAKNSVYVDMEDLELTVSVDKDKDGIYETPLEQGDANGDGNINLDDAGEILKYYAESGAGIAAGQVHLNLTYPLSLNTADMNGDGKISLSDATEILSKYAKRAVGLE